MHPKLVRYASRQLDIDTASEVAVDVMRTFWSKNPSQPATDVADRQLQSLCYRICDGAIRNALRAQRRHRTLVMAVASKAGPTESVPDVADLVTGDTATDILGKISKTDRQVLVLVADGYRVSEIAVVLGTSPAAVSMRLRRAKSNLQQALMAHGGIEGRD